MSTVTINPTTALKNFLSAEAVVKGFKVQEVKQSKALSNGTELESFKQSMITAEHINHGIKWFNSAEGMKQRKLDGMKLKVYQLGHEAYDIKKAQFYKYNQCYAAHLENKNILKDYVSFVTAEKKQGNNLERYGIKGFLKYITDETVTVKKKKETFTDTLTSGKGKEAIKCRRKLDGTYDLQGNTLDDCIMVAEMMFEGLKAMKKAQTEAKGKKATK
tara:strand:+ start:231 stop:881 length:651 start_codon:yes stop_codon:yes gene_type:complete